MEIDVKKQDENSMVFIVRDAEVPFINAIRRIAMMRVPKLAIEDVFIVKNDSAMFDEVLAHRLGLTPLVSDLESIEGLVMREDCDCNHDENGNYVDKGEYCPRCSVSFSLNETGPKVVYSRDLKSCGDSRIKPVYDTIPLLKLKEDQDVELEAVAKLGIGKEHAKWVPTTVCAYKQYPEITFNEGEDVVYQVADACPRNVLDANRDDGVIEVIDIENCSLCKTCVRTAKAAGSKFINVGYRENDFIFKIETDGSMPPKEVLLKACDVLDAKTDEFITFSEGGS
ncbi:DNA-directed RNA polymerase subunit D RpoD [Methanobrevibacter ruminantium M1]|uniref:DNA-directed RNA polymerase subunit Rpo3 n=1 Tax=Methanobrevibacter ruminantium (strain ATCC 35063 / DSM 1093 / JCM 13430 / OCM 146 / M1) TaxID=634498 RepID=D3E2J8_METRM|nr:DNA-directed RNA polymerase subunit D [Methanobrevibacter ruminantium]ADC46759.1 DNA-directed RNA polymerase subunit D RpoD [Methanobrevibacter ruminantium M1]